MWIDDLEEEIDALLATDADKQLPKPQSLHLVSTEVDKAKVSSGQLDIIRGEELSRNTAEFEDCDFCLLASAKAEYMKELDVRVCYTERAPSAGTGVCEPMTIKRTVCACGAWRAKDGKTELTPLLETDGHVRTCLEEIGTWPMREVEGRLEENGEGVTVMTASSEAALRMPPLLELLNKKRMHFLRSGFSALHDFGIEASMEIEIRDLDFSRACRLLECMVDVRRKAATLAALRQWRHVASIAMMEVATTGAETKATPAVQLSLVRKQAKLSARSEFHSVRNHGAEEELTKKSPLALLNKQRSRHLRSGFSTLYDFRIEPTIEAETRDFKFSHACRLLEWRLGGRGKTTTLAALYQWRSAAPIATTGVSTSTAAKTKKQPAIQRYLVREQGKLSAGSAVHSVLSQGAAGIVAETVEKRRQEKHFLASYILADMVRRRGTRAISKAMVKWTCAVVVVKAELELRSMSLRSILQNRNRRSMRAAFGVVLHHGAVIMAAEMEEGRRAQRQYFACRLLVGVVRQRRAKSISKAMAKWICAAVVMKASSELRSTAFLSLLRKKDKQSVRAAFHGVLTHRQVGMPAQTERKRRQEKHVLACRLLAGVICRRRATTVSMAMTKWTCAVVKKAAPEQRSTALLSLLRKNDNRSLRVAFRSMLCRGAVTSLVSIVHTTIMLLTSVAVIQQPRRGSSTSRDSYLARIIPWRTFALFRGTVSDLSERANSRQPQQHPTTRDTIPTNDGSMENLIPDSISRSVYQARIFARVKKGPHGIRVFRERDETIFPIPTTPSFVLVNDLRWPHTEVISPSCRPRNTSVFPMTKMSTRKLS